MQIISDIAVIAASFVVIWGINAWRREFKGKRRIELAEDTLTLFYKAERAIEAIRFPIYDLREGQNRKQEEQETPEQKQARDQASVTFKKIKENADIFDELYALRFRFMARFGKENAEPFDDIRGIVNQIWVYAQELARLWAKQFSNRTLSEEEEKIIREFQQVIWYSGKDDEITTKVKNIVKSVEGICRPIIDDRNSVFFNLLRKIPGISRWIK